MRVTALTAATLVIPLRNVTSFATRTVSERHYTLVKVTTESGIEGLGFCYCGNAAGWLVTGAVRDLLARHVVGRDSHETEGIWDTMYRDALLMGRRGAVVRAMSAIDIALWDANAKAKELPLYRYLGAARSAVVPAYASGGYYLAGKSERDLAAECAGYAERGFAAVKIKVGRVSAREDAARIAAVRAAIGPEVELFTDANNAWPDATAAIRAIRRWEEYDLGWVEGTQPARRAGRPRRRRRRGGAARSPPARSTRRAGTSSRSWTTRQPRFCRPMPRCAAASPSFGVSRRWPRGAG